MTIPEDTLPNRPSLLIAVALDDLELVMKDPRYVVNMDVWHEEFEDSTCHVCLAGSVMAKTLNCPIDFHGDDITDATNALSNKLDALDDFRLGYIIRGLETLKVCEGSYEDAYEKFAHSSASDMEGLADIALHEDDPEQFIKDMDRLRLALESHGL